MPRSPAPILFASVLGLLACNLVSGSTPPSAVTFPTTEPTSPPTAAPSPTESPTAEPTATLVPVEPTPDRVFSLPDPSGIRLVQVASGLERPLGLEHAGDRRLFVVEQRGVVWVMQDGQLQPTPYLDLRDRVNSSANEQGLLGLVFHPEFARNGQLFVDYTNAGGDTIVARLIAAAGAEQVDPGTEQVLLRIDQPFSNHNGGDLEFGPDGYLYVASGDGGAAADPFGNGQRLDTLLGKLLRLDVDGGEPYAVPADNPFAGGGGQPEIWAYGLRNPWRFAFDPINSDLYIGDVGQNAWEEIDFLPGGFSGPRNFGWNIREGAHTFTGPAAADMLDPVAEYANGAGGTCAVTGGVVMRSPSLPDWTGVYLFGDYCSGQVWGLVRDAAGVWVNQLLFDTDLTLSAFGTDASGEVYLVHHGGAVYRLERAQ
jgi:glucose/arabinose dehydrogenase